MMNIFKKLLLCLLSIVCLTSSINFVYADSYTLQEEFDGNWRYGSGKTGNPTKMWVNSNSWSSAVSNNNEVFCLDSTKTSVQGAYNQILTPEKLGINPDLVDKLALVVYYGYRSNKSVTNYFLTQNLIWELIGKKSHDGTIQHVVNSAYPTRASQDAWQKDILAKVDNFMKLPSFDTKTIEVKNGTYTTIEDTNKVLSGLKIKSVSNGSAKIDGNKLVVTPNGKGNMIINFERTISQAQTKTNFIVTNANGDQPVSNLCSGSDPYRASVNIKVIEPTGSIQMRKKSSYDDSLVAEAVYSLSNSKGEIVSYITTIDKGDGWVKVDNLPLDTYTLKEVKVPDGYQLDTKTYEINLSHDGLLASKTVYDEPYGYLQIRKKDADLNLDKYVGGAIYEVFDADNKLVDTLETKDDGSWSKSKALPLGDYYVKEKQAPDGYMLDLNTYLIKVIAPNVTFSKTLYDMQQGQCSIYKVDKDSKLPLKGVEFAISLDEDMHNIISYQTTNEEGMLTFDNLDQGCTYYIQEVKCLDGYLMDNTIHKIEINETNKTIFLHIDNELMKGQIKILKRDFNTKELMSGVKFKLSKNEDMSKIIKEIITNDDGVALFKDLTLGTYYLQEVYVEGYQVNNKIYKVNIAEQNEEIIIEVDNKPIKTLFDKVDKTTNKRLANVKLQVIEKESNKVIDEWISDGEKPHEILYLNVNKSYIFKEITTIEGYSLSEPIEFRLKDSQEVVTITMANEPYVDFSKVDATTNHEIAGAKLQVIEKESGQIVAEWISSNIPHRVEGLISGKTYILHENLAPIGYDVASDIEFIAGSTSKIIMLDQPYMLIEKIDANSLKPLANAKLQVLDYDTKEVIEEWISGESPYKVSNLISGKKYLLHEVQAPNGYHLADDLEFIAQPYSKIIMEDQPYVLINKKDDTTKNNIKGARLQIIDYDTKEVIAEWISDNEAHEVNSLIKGRKYILHEVKAPDGYQLGEDIIFVAGDDIVINYFNDKLKGNLLIIKVDKYKQIISNKEFEFALFTDKEMKDLVNNIKITNGKIMIEDLTYGTYYLKEIKASYPYNKSDEIYEIVIDQDEVVIKVINEKVVVTGRDNPYGLVSLMFIMSGLYLFWYKKAKYHIKKVKI